MLHNLVPKSLRWLLCTLINLYQNYRRLVYNNLHHVILMSLPRLHKEDSCNYMPFGHGPRTCLGKSLANMQLTVFLVELLQLTTFTLHNPRPDMVYLPVTKPADNLPVTVCRREDMTSWMRR